MRSFRVDDNNDMVLDSLGNFAFVDGLEAIQQNCVTAMKAQLGEMVYAYDEGVPTMATVWDNFDPAQFEAAARQVLLSVVGVAGIRSFNVVQEDDVVTYSAVIISDVGETTVTGGV